jgi:hypothetical protein
MMAFSSGGTKGMLAAIIFIYFAYVLTLPGGLIKFPGWIDGTPVIEQTFHAALFIALLMIAGEPMVKLLVKVMEKIPILNKVPGHVSSSDLSQAFGFGRR